MWTLGVFIIKAVSQRIFPFLVWPRGAGASDVSEGPGNMSPRDVAFWRDVGDDLIRVRAFSYRVSWKRASPFKQDERSTDIRRRRTDFLARADRRSASTVQPLVPLPNGV